MRLLSHHGGHRHGMADDHDDTAPVILQGSCGRTLHQLPIRAERRAVGNVDAAGDMASAEAGHAGVKGIACLYSYPATQIIYTD